jgi:membrane protein YdbS with pleckstrin-like domain
VTKNDPPKLRVLDEELDIALLPGEELLVEGKPKRGPLANYLALTWAMVLAFTCFGLVALPLVIWAARVYAKKHKYWITTNRVIVANGLIGYNVRSIPLERISDIAVRCSWLEKAFGLRSVIVRDMTGEAAAGAALMAVPDAPTMQAHVLDYVRQVNREISGSGGAKKLAATPYREVEPMGNPQKLVKLLERIEENTRHLPKLRVAADGDPHAEEEAAVAEALAAEEAAAERRR